VEMKYKVQEDLLRKIHAAAARAAAHCEREARINQAHFQSAVLEQLRFQAGRAAASAAASQEQQRLVGTRQQLDDAHATARAQVALAVSRRGAQQRAIAAMEEERQRRVNRDRFDRVCGEVVRHVAQAMADAACSAEQQERINRSLYQTAVVVQLRAAAARKAAAEAAADARAEMAAGADDAAHAAKADTVCAIARRGAQREAIAAMEHEQTRRVNQGRFELVCDELVRHVARAMADAASQAEQDAQVNQAYFRAQVMEQLRSCAARKAAAEAAEAQRAAAAAASPGDRDHATKAAVACAVERRGAQRRAIEAMEAERASRMNRDRYDAVAEQILRATSRAAAKAMMDHERAERVCSATFTDTVLPELARRSSSAACRRSRAHRGRSLVNDAIKHGAGAGAVSPLACASA